MTSQAFNFLWLNLHLPAPPDPEDGSIRQPIPENYIENVRQAGARHSKAEIRLWVDSQRLTEKQMKYLKASIEHERPNVRLMDLRGIEAYARENLYNEVDSGMKWRHGHGKHNTIWRQVDCAKILVSLQGKYDQTFFADLDYAALDITGEDSQSKLSKPGFFIGNGLENQLWGFCAERRPFFENYYSVALEKAYKGNNAFNCLIDLVIAESNKEDCSSLSSFCVYPCPDGTQAEHPDHALGNAGNKSEISFISASTLTEAFNKLPAIEEKLQAAQPVIQPAVEQPVKPQARISLAWVKAVLRRLPLPFKPSAHKGAQP